MVVVVVVVVVVVTWKTAAPELLSRTNLTSSSSADPARARLESLPRTSIA